ncbi:siderophore-interacting protein [Sphingobacterium sp. SYP-B4668]|uniref:siderophore-interacting protein n=1 Tax=Sphingobacterium sp. SYP-B4668 TaxID=2996035 RepID=UPI0022DDFFF1|nr:siderophore-interacting protein [Sphingobacterium sp. SYP-B4668]
MEKPIISKHIFKVTNKEYITPHYIRIKLRADEPTDFEKCNLGANNKIFIPPHDQKKVQFATFNQERGEWVMPDENLKPIVRTYTHRALDPATNEITIDFVNHGDNGPASSWARNAKQSDQLGVAMKIKNSNLCPHVDWYFLIGDATAIPVICCILESLPADAKGHCILEIPSEADIHPEVRHPGFQIQWLINPHPESGSNLYNQAIEVDLSAKESKFAYIACEYSSVKALRSYFKEKLGWSNSDYYAFSYWKAGVAEDKSAQERRDEKV